MAGFGLRMHALGDVPLRWDEGWSIALATVPVREALRLTALDVHPPLYYLLLAPWMALARSPELWPRLPSAMAGTLAVPLAAAAASAWWRREGRGHATQTVPIAAAAATALAPAFVYYAGVTRMYALTTPLLLLATFGLARMGAARARRTRCPAPGPAAAAALGTAAALYTFYYTAFALAGLYAAALVAWPRAWRRYVATGLGAALAYLPWLAVAGPAMATRVAQRTEPAAALDPAAVAALLDDGLFAAFFAYRAGWPAVAVAMAVMAAALLLARPRQAGRLAVVALPTALVLVGAAAGSQAHMFAPRYTIVATPFLALGLGWAAARLFERRRALGVLAAAALVAGAWPTLSGYAYTREAEVSDAYDPTELARAMQDRAAPADLVAFNVLSLAGAYELHRQPDAPAWTYGQVWDPVREPPAAAIDRVAAATRDHGRLWLVLYRGTASPGSAALKAWADGSLFPADGWWTADTLVMSYVNAPAGSPWPVGARFADGARLVAAWWSPAARPGEGIGVLLRWRAARPIARDGRVFVHAYDAAGSLVAQHDAYPVADSRPPGTWPPGETLEDRHGLVVPASARGALRLVVGLYEPDGGARWALEDGADAVPLGTVMVTP